MTLAQSDSAETKKRIFYQWLIDRMNRIGYDEIPEYYMDAWKTLDPMQLPWGFIHEWHHFWREWQSENQGAPSSPRQARGTDENNESKQDIDITDLLCWLHFDALKKFKEVIQCIMEDDQDLLGKIRQSVDTVNPVPCRRLPCSEEIKKSIKLITGGNAAKTKRLRTILRLLHHPDHGGNADMFMNLESSFEI